jgi:hypothetical protein
MLDRGGVGSHRVAVDENSSAVAVCVGIASLGGGDRQSETSAVSASQNIRP